MIRSRPELYLVLLVSDIAANSLHKIRRPARQNDPIYYGEHKPDTGHRGKQVKWRGLSRLNQAPQWEQRQNHTKKRDDQMFQVIELGFVKPEDINRQRDGGDKIYNRILPKNIGNKPSRPALNNIRA